MNTNLPLHFLPLGTSPLIVLPTTGHGKELEEPWGRKGEWDAQFELICKVNVIKTWYSLKFSVGSSLGSVPPDIL